ncbi:MucB/RseB C-terminal domain-containing protein [Pseudomonadota bacterium]
MLQSCRAWVGCFLLGVVPAGVAGDAEKSVDAWLKQMVQSVHTLSYEGTFVYLHNTQLETMQIAHAANGDQEQERIFSLNGAAREVIRSQNSVICVLPDAKSVSVTKHRKTDRRFPSVLPVNISRLSDYYDFRLLGEARIANREAVVIGVIPRDPLRYGYRLFLDVNHALPLKTDTINEEGEMVSQIMFTSLRVTPSLQTISPTLHHGKSGYTWVHPKPAQEISTSADANWKFKQLPQGFQLQVRTKRSASLSEKEMEHFVFSDGLATLSVYFEKADDENGLRKASKMGAVNVFGTQVSGYQVTVVGEVPAQTVRTVANSIEYSAVSSVQ